MFFISSFYFFYKFYWVEKIKYLKATKTCHFFITSESGNRRRKVNVKVNAENKVIKIYQ